MSFCGCLGTATREDAQQDLRKISKSNSTSDKPLKTELHKLQERRSGDKSLSVRRKNDALPTLPEHPDEVTITNGSLAPFQTGLLVNAGSMNKNFVDVANRDQAMKRQSLMDVKIMASYDSVLMDTASTMCGTDAVSLRSSVAPSSRGDFQDEEEDYDNFGTPQWTIDPHDIFFVARNDSSSKVCRVGRGEHGPVYLGVWQEQDVAVKLSKQRPTSYRAERQFHAKVAQLYGISHPNIVKFYGACFWKGGKRCVALTEYMEKGSLTAMLDKSRPRQRQLSKSIAIGLAVARGLEHLHAIGVVHGRVKSSNVLFSEDGQAKIAVPCLSTLLNHVRSHTSKSRNQTYESMTIAPEIAKGGAKSMAADIYCFGVILWRMFTDEEPSMRGLRPIRSPSEAPAKIAWLVESCLEDDPDSRPSARMIVSILKNNCA